MSETSNSNTNSSESASFDEISAWRPEDGFSDIVVVSVRSLDDVLDGFEHALTTGVLDPIPRISFVSYELMHRVLAPNRMSIVQAMTGQGPLSIREVARRVGRDFKGVHTDVTALIRNGVVQKTADGQVVFPYAKIHFDFEFGAADQPAA